MLSDERPDCTRSERPIHSGQRGRGILLREEADTGWVPRDRNRMGGSKVDRSEQEQGKEHALDGPQRESDGLVVFANCFAVPQNTVPNDFHDEHRSESDCDDSDGRGDDLIKGSGGAGEVRDGWPKGDCKPLCKQTGAADGTEKRGDHGSTQVEAANPSDPDDGDEERGCLVVEGPKVSGQAA